jgi:hypothetical protein
MYPDTELSYTFANGTTTTIPILIVAGIELDTITSGEDLFDLLVAPQPTTQQPSKVKRDPVPQSSSTGSSSTPAEEFADQMTAWGYPDPVVVSDDNTCGGYFLSNSSDVAVLNIRGFVGEGAPDGTNWAENFQACIAALLAASSQAGKKRLIVDVRGNPGGSVNTGMDAFKQIFPAEQIITKARLRIHPASDAMGVVYSSFPELMTSAEFQQIQSDPGFTSPATVADYAGENVFDANDWLQSPDGDHYNSWDQFQPVTDNGDQFTNFFSNDFKDTVLDLAQDSIVVSGYGNLTNLPPQVFDAADIVIVSSLNQLEFTVTTNNQTAQ